MAEDKVLEALEDLAAEGKIDLVVKPEKRIPLMEMFGPTVQGEGTVIGQQTYFLRFGLCDYRCKMCDSMHAVLPALVKANGERLTQKEIFDGFVEFRKPNSTDWITFSGGNPAMHDLTSLVEYMHTEGMKINVETQGTIFQPWLAAVESLTISPKGPGMGERHSQPVFEDFIRDLNNEMYRRQHHQLITPQLCIKIVVFDQRDLEFAAEIFSYLDGISMFDVTDTSDVFYLSLGNPNPPPADGSEAFLDYPALLQQYRTLCEDIYTHPVLSKVRFLPQWHTFVWGNGQGH